MVWYSMVWHGTVRYGMIWYCMVMAMAMACMKSCGSLKDHKQ